MVTPELLNYITGQLSQGKAQEEIKATLLAQGWDESDINLVFSQTTTTQPASQQPSITANVVADSQPEEPKNIFDFKNLKWYEWLAMLPAFFLMVQGGAIGAGIGVFGWSQSLKVMRNPTYSKLVKTAAVIGITIGCYVVAIFAASFFIGFIEGLSGK